jgi:membrane-associated phospholipid phosphatase
MLALFGLMQFTRAIVNLLTPLASPLGGDAYYGMSTHVERLLPRFTTPLGSQAGSHAGVDLPGKVMHFTQNGEFPSGHMATVFLCMLLVNRVESPRTKAALVVLVLVEIVTLLMSHQHFSIDVVGGPMLSYVIYHEYVNGSTLNWLKRLVGV